MRHRLLVGVVFVLGLLIGLFDVRPSAQSPFLVYGSSSGTAQVIKATSNALWVSIQSLGLLTVDAGPNARWLTLPMTDLGAVGTYGAAIGSATNAGDGARSDHVLTMGYNTTASGGRLNLTEPAFEWRIEDYYKPAGTAYMEAHWNYYDANGGQIRPIAYQVDRSNGGYLTNSTLSLSGTSVSYLAADQTQYVKFLAGTTYFYNSNKLTSLVNNVPFLTQYNAALGAEVSVAFVNASDQVSIGSTSTGVLVPVVKSVALTATSGAVGVPVVVATGRATAQSAANASISTFTVGAADASFEVSANMNVTASTTLATTLTCTYTDEANVARTMILPIAPLSGTFTAAGAISGAGASVWHTPVMHIRAKAATAITILTSAGTFTGVTYTAEGIIRRVS